VRCRRYAHTTALWLHPKTCHLWSLEAALRSARWIRSSKAGALPVAKWRTASPAIAELLRVLLQGLLQGLLLLRLLLHWLLHGLLHWLLHWLLHVLLQTIRLLHLWC